MPEAYAPPEWRVSITQSEIMEQSGSGERFLAGYDTRWTLWIAGTDVPDGRDYWRCQLTRPGDRPLEWYAVCDRREECGDRTEAEFHSAADGYTSEKREAFHADHTMPGYELRMMPVRVLDSGMVAG